MYVLYLITVIAMDLVIMYLAIYSFTIQTKERTHERIFDIWLYLFGLVQFIGSTYFLIKYIDK